MAEPSTFIKIDRNIMDWRWYQDGNTLRVFLHLLLKANIKDKDFEKITIHRGEIATSYPSLALALGLSVQNVRTAIGHLKDTGEVTVKSYAKFSVISIKNYNLYQSSNSQLTGNQQATNSQLTGNQQQSKNVRIEECKNERNNGESDKPTLSPASKKPKEIRHKYGEYQHVKLTDSEYQKLVADFGENLIRNYIQRVDEYCQQYGKSYKDYNLTIRKWLKKDNYRGGMNGNGSNIWNAGII
ncbi:MAG: hypothetical protein K2H89_05110 [Oscillospiraceae bacterium]|nr:hypothetical protein [Oscillospiraceae bacterium]